MLSPPLTSKLPNVGTSIFSVMSRLAVEHGAINLSQGFPDFEIDPELATLVTEAMARGHNQYAPAHGIRSLREALAEKYERLYGARYDPESEMTVTSGATEALFDVLTALIRSGDEVLLFEPCYDSYVPVVELAGGRPVFVSLRYPDYGIDWDEVRQAITPRTRLLLLNSPHNPSGRVLSAGDVTALRTIVDGTDVCILSDEVYEHIIFDGRRHESLARYPDLRARSFVVGSFGKTYHTTGWKIGYCAAPEPLTAELRRVHQFVTFTSPTPFQHAFAHYMQRHPDYSALAGFYQAKRDRFLELIEGSRFRAIPCGGSYFQLLDYSAIRREPDHVVAGWLLREHGVASIPTSAFLHRGAAPPVLRFCFAKQEQTLERAAERLRRV